MLTNLKHVRRETYRKTDGTLAEYFYYRPTGAKLVGRPGTPEFMASYVAASKLNVPRHADTFAELSNRYQQHPMFSKLAPSTQRERARFLGIALKKWGTVPVEALTDRAFRGAVLNWHDEIAKETPRQADNLVNAMSQVLKFAHNKGLIDLNSLANFPHAYKSNRAALIWTVEHIEAFKNFAPPELTLAMQLALATGQRLGDLCRLKWSDFDGEAINIRQGKTGAYVRVPCTRELLARLNAEPRKSITILTRANGCPWPPQKLSGRFGKASRAAGIKVLTFHDLRGTAITRLAEAGCTAMEIASISGHSFRHVTSIIEKYCARTSSLAASAMAKLERKILSKKSNNSM